MPNQDDYFYDLPPGIEAGEGAFPEEVRDLRGPEGHEQFSIHDYQADLNDPDSVYFMVVPPSGDPGAPVSDSQMKMGERFKTAEEAQEYMHALIPRLEDFQREHAWHQSQSEKRGEEYPLSLTDHILSTMEIAKLEAQDRGEEVEGYLNWDKVAKHAAQGAEMYHRENNPGELEVPGTMNVVTGELIDGGKSRLVPNFNYEKSARPQFQSAFGTFPTGKGLLKER